MRFDLGHFEAWLDTIDPGAHRRVKGLRLVTAYGIAAGLGALLGGTTSASMHVATGSLAGGFALWASVSEAQVSRPACARDLTILCAAAALGAAFFALLVRVGGMPALGARGLAGGEWILVTGAFLAGALRRYGTLGAGVGSQIYIGELLAYGAHLGPADLPAIAAAGLISTVAAVIPRLLSGPAERPAVLAVPASASNVTFAKTAEFAMGVQAAGAATAIVVINSVCGLVESAWAITACVYVVTATAEGTVERVWRRILGTLLGVPLGLACLPIAAHAPLFAWSAASLAMIVYAMALPERYDVACGAFAYALIITLAATGEHALPVLLARAWETVLGGAMGLAMALFVFPHPRKRCVDSA